MRSTVKGIIEKDITGGSPLTVVEKFAHASQKSRRFLSRKEQIRRKETRASRLHAP
jgi:hypothetical protein